jgi:hypothetical protein
VQEHVRVRAHADVHEHVNLADLATDDRILAGKHVNSNETACSPLGPEECTVCDVQMSENLTIT